MQIIIINVKKNTSQSFRLGFGKTTLACCASDCGIHSIICYFRKPQRTIDIQP